jgi:hypothetical protein
MKTLRSLLALTFIFCLAGTRAQSTSSLVQNPDKKGQPVVLDESFSVSQDTLFFLDPQAFIDGRTFYIRNPHDYAINIHYIQQTGMPFPQPVYLLWYTFPSYSTFPVAIPPHDSILEKVSWVVTDAMPKSTTIIYDTLSITTLTDAHHVIIAADSIYITNTSTADKNIVDFLAGPNPFTSRIKISWNVAREIPLTITVFNTLMQPVKTIFSGKGSGQKQEYTWDGMNENHQRVSPGVYLVRFQTSEGQKILRVIAL